MDQKNKIDSDPNNIFFLFKGENVYIITFATIIGDDIVIVHPLKYRHLLLEQVLVSFVIYPLQFNGRERYFQRNINLSYLLFQQYLQLMYVVYSICMQT